MLRLNSACACVYCFEHNLCQSHTHRPNPIQYKHMHTQTRARCRTLGLFLSLAFSLTILSCLFGLPSACMHYTRCESMLGVCVCVPMMRKTYTPRYLYAHIYDLSMSVYVWRKITILALLVPISISQIYTRYLHAYAFRVSIREVYLCKDFAQESEGDIAR